MHRSRHILGVGIWAVDQATAVEELDARFSRGQSTKVAFANANLLNMAYSSSDLSHRLTDFVFLNDGLGADLASRYLYGAPFPANLCGTDFVPAYLSATRHEFRIFVLGAKPGVAERAAEILLARCPQHEIAGTAHGFYAPSEEASVIARIRASRADIIFVGMGNPRQELWLSENLTATGCTMGFAIGALLDFLAGAVRRAPPLVRRLRCEWIYRLALEPKRLARRYLVGNAVFLARVVRQR